MMTQYLVSEVHQQVGAAASSGADNTIWVAGIFTVIGATIPLIYQAIFVHNQNRRDDHWSGVNAVAELNAAARGVLLARSTPTAPGDADATKTSSKADALAEALFRFESAYARLVLVIPDLKQELTVLRGELLLTVNSDIEDTSLVQQIEQHLEVLLEKVRTRLTFPVFKFLHHPKTSAGASRNGV